MMNKKMKFISGVFVSYTLLFYAIGKKRIACITSQARRNKLNWVTLLITVIFGLNSTAIVAAPVRKNIETTYTFDIPSLEVRKALGIIAKQTHYQLVFSSELVDKLQSSPVKGRYTVTEALDILLKGSFLSGSVTERGVIVVMPTSALKKVIEENEAMKIKRNILVAAMGVFSSGGAMANEKVSGEDLDGLLEEVIVTASKRVVGVSVQDAALAVNVLSKETIKKRGLVNMDDYLATVPGASYIPRSAMDKRVVLRGLSVGPSDLSSTASVYLGEIPLSASSFGAFNINLVDIERIEVIKGPQGTLYGSNSLGGIVRNIPVMPNLAQVEGSVKLGVSAQSESDEINQSLVGALNMPLIENQMALRVAAYQYDHAGYIDVVSTPEAEALADATGGTVIVKEDTGSNSNTGVRASLLWEPTDKATLGLTLGAQKDELDGLSDVQVALTGYQISFLNVAPSQRVETDYSNLVFEYDFGWATLLSSSSILNNEQNETRSLLPTSGPNILTGPFLLDQTFQTNMKSQEIRLASNSGGPLQYLVGLFYEEVQLDAGEQLSWIGRAAANPWGVELLSDGLREINYRQKAIFGEVSYQLNEQWLLTLGGRHFAYDRSDSVTGLSNALFNGPDTDVNTNQSDATYKANLAYTPDTNTLIYAQWSEGFRLGRGQSLPNPELCDTDDNEKLDFTDGVLTPDVETDTTENMELGLKLTFLDNRLTVNTALFRIDWNNIPVTITHTSPGACPGATQITNNIGEARSQGVELEANYHMDAWVLNISASYMDTERTKVRAPIFEGEDLIYAPRTNAHVGLQYNFILATYSAFVRTDIAYVGEYQANIRDLGYPLAGDYIDVNFRLGIKRNNWALSFYGTNMTGEDDLRITNAGSGENKVGVRAQPRKLGLELSYHF